MYLAGIVIADKAHRRHVNSARPDAPVVDDGRSPEALARRRQPVQNLRLAVARTLRSTADGLDWQLGTGRLVLDGWSTGAAPEPAASVDATQAPAATATPVGPMGAAVPIVEGRTASFTTRFDPTGTRLAVWVGEQPDATIGRLHLLVLDPETGAVNAGVAPLPGVPALRQFSMATGRLAWVSPPGQDGHESSVQVLGWSHDNFGEIRTVPAGELFIVR